MAQPSPADDPDRQAEALKVRRAYGEAVVRGDLEARVTTGEALAGLLPKDAIAQRLAAEAHLAGADIEKASYFAEKAMLCDPSHLGHRQFSAALKIRLGDFSSAAVALLEVATHPDATSEIFLHLAKAAEGMGDIDLAIKMAERAIELAPTQLPPGMVLASLYAREKNWKQASRTIEDLELRCGVSVDTRRSLSGYLAQERRIEEAFGAITEAIALAPDQIEYAIHRMSLLQQLGRMSEAIEQMEATLLDRPNDLRMRRQLVSALAQTGKIDEAISHGGILLSQSPKHEEYLTCMAFLIDARKGKQLADDTGDIAGLKKQSGHRDYRHSPPLSARLGSTVNVIVALVLREILVRHGRNKLGFLWAIFEPVVHIAVLAVIFQFSVRAPPPLGTNFFFFYFTAIAPYLLTARIASQVGNCVLGNRAVLGVPLIAPLDIAVSKVIVEVFTMAVIVLVFGAIFMGIGLNTLPAEPERILAAFTCAATLGFGIGLIYVSIVEFARLADTIVTIVLRVMYLTGGVFFVPSGIPPQFREWVLWNPLTHIVSMNRDGYFAFYDAPLLNAGYLIGVIVVTLAAGMVLLWITSPIMRVQK